MVITLARALDVPLRERNELLLAAGYAPVYRETGLDDRSMAQVRDALERMLKHHEPYPAVVMNRYWDIIMTNDSAVALFGWLLGESEGEHPPNVIRLMFKKVHPFIANWDQFGEALIQRVHREAIGGVSDRTTADLLAEVLALPGVPPEWRTPDFAVTPLPILPVIFSKDGIEVSYFSMVTTVGTPRDITLQEVRLESFFPAMHAQSATAGHR
jgi:hypothetical protein